MAIFFRAVPVFAPDGTYRGHIEGNLRRAIACERQAYLSSLPRATGRTRNYEQKLLGEELTNSQRERATYRNRDRSWKHCRKAVKPRTLCKRERGKPCYN